MLRSTSAGQLRLSCDPLTDPTAPVIGRFPRIPRENPDNSRGQPIESYPAFAGAPPMMQTPMRNLSRAVAVLLAITLTTPPLAAATTPEPPTPLAGLQGRPDVIGEEMLG